METPDWLEKTKELRAQGSREHAQSMELLLKELIQTTSDASIRSYERALLFYSDKLDDKFE